MTHENFLVTGMGRAGTKFLAEVLGQSKKWTILHEPAGARDRKTKPELIQKRFNHDFYGEVNGNLRNIADRLGVKRLAVISRHLEPVWLSYVNKNLKLSLENMMARFQLMVTVTDYLAKLPETRVISFYAMTGSIDYLEEICRWLGPNDIDFSQIDIRRKINPTRKKTYSLTDFPSWVHRRIGYLKELTGDVGNYEAFSRPIS